LGGNGNIGGRVNTQIQWALRFGERCDVATNQLNIWTTEYAGMIVLNALRITAEDN
jgi:hypothetical protein